MDYIRDIIRCLERIAPPAYQEDYDNSGLIVGDPDARVHGVLVCLDATEEVVREAAQRGCNLIVAHHPILFRGLKKITGATYPERSILQAIRHDIAIYAIHTNLDNVYAEGVNSKIGERLGLIQTSILAPKTHWHSLRIQIENHLLTALQQMLSEEGFPQPVQLTPGIGETTTAELRADPARMHILRSLLAKISPQAERDSTLQSSLNTHSGIGAGLIGLLPHPMAPEDFLDFLKERMIAKVVRHTSPVNKSIQRVALCGGSGSFLLRTAIAQKADVFVSADFKYHEFFDAEQRIMIADIGHFETEQFTIELLQQIISRNFSNFAAYCTKTVTNPVLYR